MNIRFWRRHTEGPTNKKKKSVLREWLDAAGFAIIAATLIRTFIFEAFCIPTPSMEKTLLVNDYLFVSKVTYGPRIPMTPLAVPFTAATLPYTKANAYSEAVQWGYHRLPGLRNIERYDVVVFNLPAGDTVATETEDYATYYQLERQMGREAVWQQYHIKSRPVDKRQYYIKRCMAIAGDTMQIRNGDVYVNGKAAPIPGESQHQYWVTTDGDALNPSRMDDLNATDQPSVAGNGVFIYNLTPGAAAAVKNFPVVKSATTHIDDDISDLYPYDTAHFKWTQDNYGPITIPSKGATVQLSSSNIELYRRIIEVYEQNKLEENNGQFMINGKPANTYTFKMNYYWMMGDNRNNSLDSRYWGFVPEDHVVGKASLVWFSYGSDGIRWKRIFSLIN